MANLSRRCRGAHYYNGRFSSRGKRALSKIHKGMPECGDVKAAFERVELERKERKELARHGKATQTC